jgi:hypothetical protein
LRYRPDRPALLFRIRLNESVSDRIMGGVSRGD